MGSIKISIIVPVYKVESYLDRCIASIMNQTYNNIEIILVDDDSPDNCPYMCNEYAKEDSRVKVIHKENGGLSDSRNEGLKAATGDYVLFVDSDDYIELNTCETFSKFGQKSNFDIIVGGANVYKDEINYYEPSKNLIEKNITGEFFLIHELKNKNMRMASVFNLYRREFLIKNELYFKKDLLHEDEYWTPRVFLRSNNIFVLGYKFYNYIVREGSITTQSDFSKNAKHITQIVTWLSVEYSTLNRKTRDLLNDYLVGIYLFAFKKGKLYLEDKSYIKKTFVLMNSKSPINRIKALVFFISPKLYVVLSNWMTGHKSEDKNNAK